MGQMIWLSCEGENPADKENIGAISYYPYPGFPTYHYPYEKQKDYLSPAVFAHLKNPKRKLSHTYMRRKTMGGGGLKGLNTYTQT